MKRQVNREQFIESVYHLSFYGNILKEIDYTRGESFISGFSENQIKTTSFSIQWNILIITQSLIDELNRFLFNYTPDDISLKNRIKGFKKIIDPALNEIKKWKDMQKFRNHILAHNGRDYYGKSMILNTGYENYNIPIFHNDFYVLLQLLKIITEKVEETFAEEKQEADRIMESIDTKQKEVITCKQNWPETLNKLDKVISEVKERASKIQFYALVKISIFYRAFEPAT
jgi:hypothetical protein